MSRTYAMLQAEERATRDAISACEFALAYLSAPAADRLCFWRRDLASIQSVDVRRALSDPLWSNDCRRIARDVLMLSEDDIGAWNERLDRPELEKHPHLLSVFGDAHLSLTTKLALLKEEGFSGTESPYSSYTDSERSESSETE